MKAKLKTSLLIAFVFIVVASIVFSSLFIREYVDNTHLLNKNQHFVNDAIKRSLENQLRQRVDQYIKRYHQIIAKPFSKQPDFFIFQGKDQQFPYRYLGDPTSNSSRLNTWQDRYNGNQDNQNISSESRDRIKLTRKLVELLASKADKEAIKTAFYEFIEHKTLYRLSTLKEALALTTIIKADINGMWTNQLLKALLIDGVQLKANSKVSSLFTLLFKENKDISKVELAQLLAIFKQLLEQANLNVSYYDAYQQALFSTKSTTTWPHTWLKDSLYISEKWLLASFSDSKHILLPLDLTELTSEIQTIAIAKGNLLNEDKLSIENVKGWQVIEDIKLSFQRESLQRSLQQQRKYLMAKLGLLLVFICLSVFSIIMISRRFQRQAQYLKMREQFINMVSHELQTPLSAIRLMAETLDRRNKKNLDPKDYAKRIVNESYHLSDMVENLLSFRHIGIKRFKLQKTVSNLQVLVNESVENILDYSTVALEVENGIPQDIELNVDAQLFKLVIKNLIINASKFTQRSPVCLQFNYHNTAQRLTMIDNAIGIKPDEWERVFEEFYRSKEGANISGTGLGLTLSKRIIKAHGWKLSIIKSNDQGTTWAIDFK